MIATALLLSSLAFAESKTLAAQIGLDRAGFSCNAIDGQWGKKSQRALKAYCGEDLTPDAAYDKFFANETDLFTVVPVTQADLDSIVTIPDKPAEKSRLTHMGYESIAEMFAERGHLKVAALKRMNPGVDWAHVPPGLQLVIPKFPPISDEFKAGDRGRKRGPKRPLAAEIRVSLSRYEVTAYDQSGKMIALFPCSIARDKSKRPQSGELKVTSYIEKPNYTYTPDFVPKGKKAEKFIFPSGPNCPVGIAWLGLNLPGYGIHGTPKPESIGSAESHGCFRLANWNAARLYALCKPGTKVVIEP